MGEAAARYLRERGMPRRLGDLASHAWIAFTPIPHPWTLQTRDGKKSVRLQRTVGTSSTAGGRALALAGLGLFAAPRFVLEVEVAAGRLVRVLPNVKLPQVTLYAAWPGQGEPPRKTREFIELDFTREDRAMKVGIPTVIATLRIGWDLLLALEAAVPVIATRLMDRVIAAEMLGDRLAPLRKRLEHAVAETQNLVGPFDIEGSEDARRGVSVLMGRVYKPRA